MHSLKRTLGFLFLISLTVFFVVFAVANREPVGLSFFPLPYVMEAPKFLMALVCFALGALVCAMVASMKLSRIKRLLKAEHRRAEALMHENKALRMESVERLPSP